MDRDCKVDIVICIFCGVLVFSVIKLFVLFSDIFVVFWVLNVIKLKKVVFFEWKSFINLELLLNLRFIDSCRFEWFWIFLSVKFGDGINFINVIIVGVDLI